MGRKTWKAEKRDLAHTTMWGDPVLKRGGVRLVHVNRVTSPPIARVEVDLFVAAVPQFRTSEADLFWPRERRRQKIACKGAEPDARHQAVFSYNPLHSDRPLSTGCSCPAFDYLGARHRPVHAAITRLSHSLFSLQVRCRRTICNGR